MALPRLLTHQHTYTSNDVADIKALKNHRCAKIITTDQIL